MDSGVAQAAGEWLGVRMELTGAAMLAACGAMLVIWRDSIHAGQVTSTPLHRHPRPAVVPLPP